MSSDNKLQKTSYGLLKSLIFRIDPIALNSSEKFLWTSKHHFWKVHFWWPKANQNTHIQKPFLSHLKYGFGHQKSASQKWCLEVRRTFSNDFRTKKRFWVGWMYQNVLFWSRHLTLSKTYHKNIILCRPLVWIFFTGFKIFRKSPMDL